MDLVIERVEPSSGVGLGRPVERSLQITDLVLLGGTSHDGHSPVLPCARRVDEAAALPSPRVLLSRRLKRYYGRLRRLPGTPPLPGRCAGYRTGLLRRNRSQPPGRGGPPQFPPPPSERSAPSTPGGSSGLRSRLFAPSLALAVTVAARLLLFPAHRREPLTTRQASLDATDRSVAPPTGLLTLGFDPARYRTEPPACYRASWQLPGRDLRPLATTSLCWIRSPQSTTSNSGHTRLGHKRLAGVGEPPRAHVSGDRGDDRTDHARVQVPRVV